MFVAQRQGVQSLTDQVELAVLTTGFTAIIHKHFIDGSAQTQAFIHFRQQQDTGIAGDVATAKIGF